MTGPPARRLADRVRDRLEALLRDPAIQRRALAIPGLRGVALRQAERLFDLLAGFTYTQALLAAVRLDAFEALAGGPHPTAALAPRLGLSEPAAERLLLALAALDLAERTRDGWRLGPLGLPLRGQPALATLLEHDTLLYDDLREPERLLRDDRRTPTHLSEFWAYARAADPRTLAGDAATRYSAVMALTQPLVAAEVLDAYPLGRHHRLLDVGGGDGTFLRAVAARVPGLALSLFELPPVAVRARSAFEGAGLAGRVTIHEGSFLADALPTGADCISLVRVCFDHDDETVAALFRRAHAALPPGGRLLVAEPMRDLPHARRVGDVYFNLYLLAMRSGRPRSPSEHTQLLVKAGFSRVETRRTRSPIQSGLVVATR